MRQANPLPNRIVYLPARPTNHRTALRHATPAFKSCFGVTQIPNPARLACKKWTAEIPAVKSRTYLNCSHSHDIAV